MARRKYFFGVKHVERSGERPRKPKEASPDDLMTEGISTMYSETRDASGNLIIRDQTGAIIPEDYENQKYCDFLTWKSHQGLFNGPDFFLLNGPCFFFSDL